MTGNRAHDEDLPTDPARHYDRITPAWNIILGDDFHHGLFAPGETDLKRATARLTETMAEAAAPPPQARIVDLGCGTGTQACWLAERYGAARVVGVSTSEVGVAVARRRSQAAGLGDTVTFVQGDALHSGLEGGAWDIVWLIESSQYLVPRERMMHECARLLTAGGRMALCDVILRQALSLRDLRRLHRDLDVLRGTFGEAVMATIDEYRETARMAGLSTISETDLSERVLPTFARWADRARRAGPDVTALIGEAGLANFLEACDVMERFMTEGNTAYALMIAEKPIVRSAASGS